MHVFHFIKHSIIYLRFLVIVLILWDIFFSIFIFMNFSADPLNLFNSLCISSLLFANKITLSVCAGFLMYLFLILYPPLISFTSLITVSIIMQNFCGLRLFPYRSLWIIFMLSVVPLFLYLLLLFWCWTHILFAISSWVRCGVFIMLSRLLIWLGLRYESYRWRREIQAFEFFSNLSYCTTECWGNTCCLCFNCLSAEAY